MGTALKLSEDKPYYEVLNGKIVAMASASVNHATVTINILSIFKRHFKGMFYRVFSEVDVFLSDKDTFIPDLMVVCKPDIIKRNGINGAPDLVVEVLSPSTIRYDRG